MKLRELLEASGVTWWHEVVELPCIGPPQPTTRTLRLRMPHWVLAVTLSRSHSKALGPRTLEVLVHFETR